MKNSVNIRLMISKQTENYFKTRVFGQSSDRLIKMTVSGNSMWPFLRHGQEISIRKLIRNDDIHIGDVVVIKVRNFFLIHRVLLKRKSRNGKCLEYFTKGDRRLVGDGWIRQAKIIGVASFSLKNKSVVKYLAMFQSCQLLLFGIILRKFLNIGMK